MKQEYEGKRLNLVVPLWWQYVIIIHERNVLVPFTTTTHLTSVISAFMQVLCLSESCKLFGLKPSYG